MEFCDFIKLSNRTINIILSTLNFEHSHNYVILNIMMYTLFLLTIDATEPVPTRGNTNGIYSTYPQHVKPGTATSQAFLHALYFIYVVMS